jgi:Membrane bound beta barrel domain (DUF5777)
MLKKLLFTAIAALTAWTIHAQGADSLMNLLNDNGMQTHEAVRSTFKATRIVNSSTVENLGAGTLDFRISHRFGQLNQGSQNFFGLDDATTRIGLDYGITGWLMVGLGHSTLYKEDDGFAKLKILRQKTSGMPITLCYFGDVSVHTGTPSIQVPEGKTFAFHDRLYFAHQLLIAHKFNNWLSLQIMPSYVHFNLVDSSKYSNDMFAIGVGGRIKLNRRFALTGEYYYTFSGALPGTYNALSLGVDIETGGHVFQMFFTNSTGMTERTYIAQTTDSWNKGQIHFGFNISRIFTVVHPKEFEGSRNKVW